MTKKERENIAKAKRLCSDVRSFLTDKRNEQPVDKQNEYNSNIDKLVTVIFDLLKETR